MRDWVRVHTSNIAMVHGSRRAGDVLYCEVEAHRMDEEVGFDLPNGREDEFCERVFSHVEGGQPRDRLAFSRVDDNDNGRSTKQGEFLPQSPSAAPAKEHGHQVSSNRYSTLLDDGVYMSKEDYKGHSR